MIIKELINPKPKAIVIFIVFSLLFFLTPLLRNGFLETFSIEHISPIILFIVSLLIVPAHACKRRFKKNIILLILVL
jgi:uncharacterized membrane protein